MAFTMIKSRRESEHYVNNKEFFEAIVEYRRLVLKSQTENTTKPRITNYLGECFLKIATHLSYKPNFVNYMFREDMISDGIENCVQYIDRFNPEKSSNPFAYFTQVIYYAFLRRIAKEKRQLEVKSKLLDHSGFDEVFVSDDTILASSNSDLNTIKNNIQYRLNNY